MKFFFKLLFLVQLITNAMSFQQGPIKLESEPKPIMVAHLFRHGARNPLYNMFNETWVTEGNGELTAPGMHEHYMLGKATKEKYPHLFPEQYDANKYRVQCSHSSRTINSATSHNMGIYDLGTGLTLETLESKYIQPPFILESQNNKFAAKKDRDALTQRYSPIPIYTEKEKGDYQFFVGDMDNHCPYAAKLINSIQKSKKQFLDKTFKPTSDKYKAVGYDPKKMFGMNDFDVIALGQLFDYLRSYLWLKGKLTKEVDFKLYEENQVTYAVDNWSKYIHPDINKLWTHTLSQKVRQEFQKKIDDPTYQQNYLVLSGHDSNITPLLFNVGVSSFDCQLDVYVNGPNPNKKCLGPPQFAADIIWELSTTHNPKSGKTEHLVRMLYNGNPFFDCTQNNSLSKPPKYVGYCTMEEFVEASQNIFELGNRFNEVCFGKSHIKNTCPELKKYAGFLENVNEILENRLDRPLG